MTLGVIGRNAVYRGDVQAVLAFRPFNQVFLLQRAAQELRVGTDRQFPGRFAVHNNGNADGLGPLCRLRLPVAVDDEQDGRDDQQHHCGDDKHLFVLVHFTLLKNSGCPREGDSQTDPAAV